jgi:hypothetical protein
MNYIYLIMSLEPDTRSRTLYRDTATRTAKATRKSLTS